MKYFKIANRGTRTVQRVWELTKAEWDVEMGDYANNADDFYAETEDGELDYEAIDAHISELVEQAEEDAKSDYGLDTGDYTLYIKEEHICVTVKAGGEVEFYDEYENHIEYSIDVLKELANAGYSTYRLREEKILPESVISKLRRYDTSISLDTLGKLCKLLNMQPGDIIEYND